MPAPRSRARPLGNASGPSIAFLSSSGRTRSQGVKPTAYMRRYAIPISGALTHVKCRRLLAPGEGDAGDHGDREEPEDSREDDGTDFTGADRGAERAPDRKSTRLNSSHLGISYAVF